jgi:hypothetical protein
MARVVSVRADRELVANMVGEPRETAEKMLQALSNDFARMRHFRRANPRAQLAGPDRAFVSIGDNMFHAELQNVVYADTARVAEEAAEFGGLIACVNGVWTLSVPLGGETGVASTSLLATLTALALFGLAAAVLSPERTAAFVWWCLALLGSLPARIKQLSS